MARARPSAPTLASLGPLSGRVIALERSFWSLHEGEGERRVRGERERGRLRGCGALVKHPQLVRGFGIREAVRAPRRPPTVVHVQARRAAGLRGHLFRGVGSSSHRRVRYASLQRAAGRDLQGQHKRCRVFTAGACRTSTNFPHGRVGDVSLQWDFGTFSITRSIPFKRDSCTGWFRRNHPALKRATSRRLAS